MKKIFLILLVFVSISTFAQNEPDDIIKEFFELYESNGTDAALDYIFSTNKWLKESQAGIDDLKSQLNSTIKLIGEYYGYSPIVTRTISGHMELRTYIVKYNRQPLRFSFLVYKPNDTWRLQNFKFDDSLDQELEEASAVYRLKENLPDY